VVESLDSREILFVPDQYLGSYIAAKAGREMHLWPGYCPTHIRIQPQDIIRQRAEHPQAKVLVHPECRREVAALADEVLSTGGMLRFVRDTGAEEIVIGTEIGILHRLRKENPKKRFFPASDQAVCPRMKLITIERALWSLQEMTPVVKVPEEIRLKAKVAVDWMMEIGRSG
jgi:quinolinate synthase